MQAWTYNLQDVLLITRNGEEKVARIAGFVDSLDNTKPLYVNLRVADGKRWSSAVVKIQPDQIIKHLQNWYEEQQASFDASIKEAADRIYAKMSPEQRAQLAVQIASPQRRSPLDIMIDRACGIDSE